MGKEPVFYMHVLFTPRGGMQREKLVRLCPVSKLDELPRLAAHSASRLVRDYACTIDGVRLFRNVPDVPCPSPAALAAAAGLVLDIAELSVRIEGAEKSTQELVTARSAREAELEAKLADV